MTWVLVNAPINKASWTGGRNYCARLRTAYNIHRDI